MSIRTFWIVLLFIFSIKLNAQQIIDGYYDPAHKEFFAKANLLNRFNEPYEISTFEDGFATIKLLKTAADRQLEIENNVNGVMVVSENRDRIGLMDSTGRVVLPMRYNKLERLNWNYNKYYKFRVNDSIGIATIDGRELIKLKKWKMDKSVGKYNRCLEEYKNGVSINSTIHRDIVSVKSGDKIGLFSLLKEKYLIPIEFDCVPHPMKECLFYSDGRAEIHINGDAAFPEPVGSPPYIENEWGIHQVETTADFAPRNRLSLCNAGHPAPLCYRAADRTWSVLRQPARTGAGLANVPWGIIDDVNYEQISMQLGLGDLLVMYTDSLIESLSPEGKLLGEEGLLNVVRGLDPMAPAEFIPSLLKKIAALHDGNLKGDDVTVLVLRPNGISPRVPLRDRVFAPFRVLGGLIRSLKPGAEPAPWPEFSLPNVGGAIFHPLNRLWSGTARRRGN